MSRGFVRKALEASEVWGVRVEMTSLGGGGESFGGESDIPASRSSYLIGNIVKVELHYLRAG